MTTVKSLVPPPPTEENCVPFKKRLGLMYADFSAVPSRYP